MRKTVIQLAVGALFLVAIDRGLSDSSASEFGAAEAATVNSGSATCADASKVVVCHRPSSRARSARALCIDKQAVEAHVTHHGDVVGACTSREYAAAGL